MAGTYIKNTSTNFQDEHCPFKINLFFIEKKVSQNVDDISCHTILTQFKNKTIMSYLIKILKNIKKYRTNSSPLSNAFQG